VPVGDDATALASSVGAALSLDPVDVVPRGSPDAGPPAAPVAFHTTVRMTMEWYGDVLPERLHAAADAMDDILGRDKSSSPGEAA
jgi:hypothetical protein